MKSLTYFLSSYFILFAFQLNAQFSSIQHSITNSYDFVEISNDESLVVIGGIKQAKSLDGGITFTTLNLGNYELPFTLFVYKDAAIVDQNEFCLIGKDETNHKSILIKTYDGGSTWTVVMSTANGSYDYYNDIEYGDGIMMVTADGGVYRSTDNGDSWTFISISVAPPKLISYNEVSNEWIIMKSNTSYYKSSDNGLSWTSVSASLPQSGTTTMLGNHNDHFLINKSLSSGGSQGDGTMFLVNSNLDIQASISYSGDITDSDPIQDIYFLPDSNIIASGIGHFFYIDSSESHVYDFNHHLIDGNGTPVQTTDFEFASTFGIAVGMYGGISRYDASLTNDISVTPAFSFTSNTCPGDTLEASPFATYADSSVWYYNGNYISTDTLLVYETPYLFGSNDLVLNNWYNGSYTTDTMDVYFNSLQPAPNYSLNHVDSLPCYGDQAVVQIGYNSGWTYSGSSVNAWLGDSLIYSQSPAPSGSWTNFLTPEIYQDDSVYIVSSYQQNCGVTVDSLLGFIYVGDDLSDNYSYTPGSDTICSGQAIDLILNNTLSNNTYSVTSNHYWSNSGDVFQGGSTNLDLHGPVGTASPFSTQGRDYYFELTIENDNNCSYTVALDSVHVILAHVLFEEGGYAHYIEDTMNFVNFRSTNNHWSVEPNYLNVDNPLDSVPLIYGDSVGIYNVELKQAPLPGCVDSLHREVWYGDSLSLPPLQVENEFNSHDFHVYDVKGDDQGNRFMLSTPNLYDYHSMGGNPGTSKTPVFRLSKFDENDSLLWYLMPDDLEKSYNFDGNFLTDYEIDANGDLYCALWITSETHHEFGPMSWNGMFLNYPTGSFIFKVDGGTGDILWYKNMNFLTDDYYASGHWKISDLFLNHGEMLISITSERYCKSFRADLNGNIIAEISRLSSVSNDLVFPSSYPFQEPSTLSSDDGNTYPSPRFYRNNSGELCMLGYYLNKLENFTSAISELNGVSSNGQFKPGIFHAKLNDDFELYDFVKIAALPYAEMFGYQGELNFDIDGQGRLIIAGAWGGPESFDFEIEIMDSIINLSRGTFVFQLSDALNLNWLTLGSGSSVTSLDVSEGNGYVYLSGTAPNSIAFKNGFNVSVMGEADSISNAYNNLYTPSQNEPYYVILNDDDGELLYGDMYETFNNGNEVTFSDRNYLIDIFATPCEDVFLNFSYKTTDSVQFKSRIDTVDIGGSNGSMNKRVDFGFNQTTCNIAGLNQDTVYFCTTDSLIFIPVNNGYGIDSIQYEILSGGIPMGSNTVDYLNGGFYIQLIQSWQDIELEIFSPFIDSVVLIEKSTLTPIALYDDFICLNDSVEVLMSDGSLYSWGGGNYSSDSTKMLYGESLGVHQLAVNTIFENQCIVYDTIVYEVGQSLIDTLPGLSNLSCEDSLVYFVDSTTAQTDEWLLNGSNSNNSFHSGNLIDGNNQIEVSITDTNGCVYTDELILSYIAPVLPTFDNFYQVACNETEIIQYNDQDYSSVTFSVNGVNTQNLFGPNNLNPGSNIVIVDLTDINGCDIIDTFYIDYCTAGVEEINESDNGIIIYPNPAEDYLYVDLNGINKEGVRIKLIDNMGRIIKECKYQEKMAVSELSRGTYIIKLTRENNVIFEKLIVINN